MARFTYSEVELDARRPEPIDECIPDHHEVTRWTADLLEPAQVEALMTLDESERAVRVTAARVGVTR